jgi:uncharacterized membrane protein
VDKARLESFSDGVFAFSITLLVLGFQVPELKDVNEPALRRALIAQVPQIVPWVTSFATVGIIWLNHHTMFHAVDRVERGTLILNLLLLLIVSFIPYPTAVLGRYGPLPSDAVLYGCTLTLLGFAYNLLWRHIARRRLSRSLEDPASLRARTRRNLTGAIGYPAGTVVAFFAPRVAVCIYLALTLFYLTPERGGRRRAEAQGG